MMKYEVEILLEWNSTDIMQNVIYFIHHIGDNSVC